MHNKPFLLRPSGKDYLWGGTRLKTEFGKDCDLDRLAETWECSTHPDGLSYVASGEFEGQSLAEVIEQHPDFLGNKHTSNTELPFIVKLIDARLDLSVQVHPDDEYARVHEHGQRGKTEMWYVLEAEPNSSIIFGLTHDISRDDMLKALEEGTAEKYFQRVPVKKGDVFFIPAGTIHAIGAGILVAEVQESSNITYRLYDYNRKGPDGNKRELHIDKALDVAMLNRSVEPRQPLRITRYSQGVASDLVGRCRYFEVIRILLNGTSCTPTYFSLNPDCCHAILCVQGSCNLFSSGEQYCLEEGCCLFAPAGTWPFFCCVGSGIILDVSG